MHFKETQEEKQKEKLFTDNEANKDTPNRRI